MKDRDKTKSAHAAFIADLRELLTKHNAEIEVEVYGDYGQSNLVHIVYFRDFEIGDLTLKSDLNMETV